ncbi:defensin-like protein AX2 [Amaranthus tricolor]|uniref:defensin-like protein AX2 n=1 Tax=Amaranthus tricolor TaxID=29722 RepID=UPI002588EA7E|nr:defensin-like protein AX2 [Amaranthus tricolor]
MEKKFVGLVLLIVLVLLASDMCMVEVEADTCTKPSKYFKGVCGGNGACRNACSRESWPSGRCVGPGGLIFQKCQCERPC